jgi:hypothetical protein
VTLTLSIFWENMVVGCVKVPFIMQTQPVIRFVAAFLFLPVLIIEECKEKIIKNLMTLTLSIFWENRLAGCVKVPFIMQTQPVIRFAAAFLFSPVLINSRA